MPKPKSQGKKNNSEESDKEPTILATGLEDYGRWKAMFKDHKREEGDPPFRRGRIWA